VFVVVAIVNAIENAENVVDLQWFPSNLICIQSANVPHLLETLCHVPF
jgi:hypothetical protein